MHLFYRAAVAAALLAVPAAVDAQAQPDQRGPGSFILQHRAELNLSAEQVARLEAIQQRVRSQNEPLLAQLRAAGLARGEPGQIRAHIEGRTPEQRAAMRQRFDNMTPEQREQLRSERRQRLENMTPEQREQLRSERRQRLENMTPEQREQLRGERRQRPGAQGARAGRQVPEELRPVLEQLRAHNQAAMQEVRSVLTAEQQTRLRALMGERRGPRAQRQGR
jgi:hypothetical protein